jgi:hypothetical protein
VWIRVVSWIVLFRHIRSTPPKMSPVCEYRFNGFFELKPLKRLIVSRTSGGASLK